MQIRLTQQQRSRIYAATSETCWNHLRTDTIVQTRLYVSAVHYCEEQASAHKQTRYGIPVLATGFKGKG